MGTEKNNFVIYTTYNIKIKKKNEMKVSYQPGIWKSMCYRRCDKKRKIKEGRVFSFLQPRRSIRILFSPIATVIYFIKLEFTFVITR